MILLLERECMISSLFMKNVTVKLKVPEAAKAGKGTRAIGDFTCPGSLLAPFLVGPLKSAFAQRIEHDDCVIRFVESTDKDVIDEIMTEMYVSEKNYFVFFSDDMVCKIIRNGRAEFYNLDISSCDKSNSRSVFMRLKWFFEDSGWHELIERAIEQCRSPIYMMNPHDQNEYITAQTIDYTEFSGTILTTPLNNIAASAICLSIHYHLSRARDDEETPDIVSRSAFAVGYLVTAERCTTPEEIQFLKMSFWEDTDGRLHSFLNLGAILRSFGTCWMDYPFNSKKGETLDDAIRYRNWSVLKGYKHAGCTEVYEALVASRGCVRGKIQHSRIIDSHVANENLHKHWLSTTERLPVPRDSILKRYGMDLAEYRELCKLISESDVGRHIHCTAVYRILEKDYAYAVPKELSRRFC